VGVPAPWSAKFFAYPGVPGGALEVLRRVVPGLAARAETFLGLGSEIPVIYLHKSPQALRQYACVNDATVAYYDGSIHLSVSVGDNFVSEITNSVEHEYVHHVLLSHDITRPIWFQEGAAMIFAKESWAQYRFVTQPIPLATMVEAFAHTSKPEQAEAFYMEAYGMVRLLQTLWKKSEPSSEADLVDALLDRQVTPDALFQTALHERSPESKLAPLDQLQAFIASGFGLGASFLPRSSLSPGSSPGSP
jgi:hypothetical protein